MQVAIISSWFKYKKIIKVNWSEKIKSEFKEEMNDIYHAVIFTTLDTPYEIVRESLKYLNEVSYDIKNGCGYRCDDHNKNRGGSNTSLHPEGKAADIPFENNSIKICYLLFNLLEFISL